MFEGELLGVFALTWQAAVMLGLGGLLIYLGIAKQVEPVLLVPIGMGVILANVPPGHGRRADSWQRDVSRLREEDPPP